ncbi:MAG: hypothetical protein IPG90_16900 [Bacteroidetes bacterium]|nr:hypothetical protein [Bacteroidota bacterium]
MKKINSKFHNHFFRKTRHRKKFSKAINNVSKWWQEKLKGSTTQLNDEFEYRMPGIHFQNKKLVELIPKMKSGLACQRKQLEFL